LKASVDQSREGMHLRRSSPQTVIMAVCTRTIQIWSVEGRSYLHTVAHDFRMLKHCTVQCLNVQKSYLLWLSDVGLREYTSDLRTWRHSENNMKWLRLRIGATIVLWLCLCHCWCWP